MEPVTKSSSKTYMVCSMNTLSRIALGCAESKLTVNLLYLAKLFVSVSDSAQRGYIFTKFKSLYQKLVANSVSTTGFHDFFDFHLQKSSKFCFLHLLYFSVSLCTYFVRGGFCCTNLNFYIFKHATRVNSLWMLLINMSMLNQQVAVLKYWARGYTRLKRSIKYYKR